MTSSRIDTGDATVEETDARVRAARSALDALGRERAEPPARLDAANVGDADEVIGHRQRSDELPTRIFAAKLEYITAQMHAAAREDQDAKQAYIEAPSGLGPFVMPLCRPGPPLSERKRISVTCGAHSTTPPLTTAWLM